MAKPKNREVSYEEAYIARFHGRTATCREALIDLDGRAGKAVKNSDAFETFLSRYREAGTILNAKDAYFYSIFFERERRITQAQAWFEVHARISGTTKTLRMFYVRYGLATQAMRRFTLTDGECRKIIEGNLKRLSVQRYFRFSQVEDTIKACVASGRRHVLPDLLTKCIGHAQPKAAMHVAASLGRDLTIREMQELGQELIAQRLDDRVTFDYVKKMRGIDLASTYIDALIYKHGAKPDFIRARACDLEYELTTEQWKALYAEILDALNAGEIDMPPNLWVPVAEEIATRSPEHAAILPEVYAKAREQALYSLNAGQASYFAEKQGKPLTLMELHAQHQQVNDPTNEVGPATRTYVRSLLVEELARIIPSEPKPS